jgi:hypothetical protein
MMSYKIRASGASHQFGNLSTLSARQVHLIELRKCLIAAALHYIAIAACMWSRSRNYFEDIVGIFSIFALVGSPEISLWNTDLTSFSVGGYRRFGPTACILWLILTFHISLIFRFHLSQRVLNYSPITNFLFHFLLFSFILYNSICQRWMHWFYYRSTACISA